MFHKVLMAAALVAGPVWSATVIPDFMSAEFSGVVPENPYFPMRAGTPRTYLANGIDDEGDEFTERSVHQVLGPGRELLGVQTTAILDRAYEDGLLVEETYDYFATDTVGAVWYFGEDVVNFIYNDDDVLIETNNESAWLAGVDGALPGWIMPAEPTVGLSYFQEVAAANGALDEAMIWAIGQSLDIEGLGTFADVVVTLETTELDPDAREFKYYAPGFGLIRMEEGLSPDYKDPELVFNLEAPSQVPLLAGFPLLLAGIGLLSALKRRS